MRPTDPLGAVVYDAVRAALTDAANDTKPNERVYQADAESHGVSWRWMVDRSREGALQLHGPRGRRFAYAADLARLVDATQVKRSAKSKTNPIREAVEDARAVVAALARRRA